MAKKYSKYLCSGLMLVLLAVMVVPLLNSCGKSNEGTVNGNNTQLIVANLSPDVYPIDLFIDNLAQNATPYRFPNVSAYFYLTKIGLPLQIRTDTGTRRTLDSLTVRNVTVRNAKYTLLITGLSSDNTLRSIFMVDTSVISTVGRGKLRFVNASPRSVGFDVYANGSKLFSSIAFGKYSDFTELPAGNYDIKIYNQGDLSAIIREINPVTIGDGKLYTMYTYGTVGRTDSAAFNTGIIINK